MGADLNPDAGTPSLRLWNRNLSLFFVARAAARLGDTMLPVGLAAGLIEHGYGAGAVGAAMASFSACFAGFVIFGGVIADRLNTRAVMVCADLIRLATQSLMAAMFFTDRVVLWQVCAIGAVNGLCAALFQPGVASTLARIAADVQGANGIVRTAESVMTIAGPAFAGVLIGITTAGGVFACDALTYLISALCLLGLRATGAAGDQHGVVGRFRENLIEGWREFWARDWLWSVIVIWMVLMLTAFAPTTPLMATAIITTHGDRTYGLVNALGGLGMAAGGLLAMRIRPRFPLRAGVIAMFAYFAQSVSVGLRLPVPVIAVGFACTGAALAFWGVMWATTVQTQVPTGILNRIHAYEVAGSLAMMPVGQALAGPVAQLVGLHSVLLINGAISVVGCVVLIAVPAIRGLVRVSAPLERVG
jgi:MFS family permease